MPIECFSRRQEWDGERRREGERREEQNNKLASQGLAKKHKCKWTTKYAWTQLSRATPVTRWMKASDSQADAIKARPGGWQRRRREEKEKRSAHHFDGCCLDEDRFGQKGIMWVLNVNALSSQNMQHSIVAHVVITWVGINIGECHTIQLSWRQRLYKEGLKSIFSIVIFIVGVFELFRYFVVERFGE